MIPREWFLVPLFVIDEAVEKIKDGTISDYVYDPKSASSKKNQPALITVDGPSRGFPVYIARSDGAKPLLLIREIS